MRKPIVVNTILVDRCTLFREGLVSLMATSNYRISRAMASLTEDPAPAPEGKPPNLYIVGGPQSPDAVSDIVVRLRRMDPKARVVALLEQFDYAETMELIRVGADGVILKSISCECMLRGLDVIMHDELVLPAAFRRQISRQGGSGEGQRIDSKTAIVGAFQERGSSRASPAMGLSLRETGVVHGLLMGESNKSIARRLDISEATVKIHVKTIFRKIKVRNRTQAALWAKAHLPACPNGTDRLNGSDHAVGSAITVADDESASITSSINL